MTQKENRKHSILFYRAFFHSTLHLDLSFSRHLSLTLSATHLSLSFSLDFSLALPLSLSFSLFLSLIFSVWLSFRLSLKQSFPSSFKSCRKLNVLQPPLLLPHQPPTPHSPSPSSPYFIFWPLSLAWLLVCITNSPARCTISWRLLALRQHATCNTLRYLWPLLAAWPGKVATTAAA